VPPYWCLPTGASLLVAALTERGPRPLVCPWVFPVLRAQTGFVYLGWRGPRR
jgi:hypothetical protein